MSTSKPSPRLALFVCVVACTGLDPEAFKTGGPPPGDSEVAGFSFDAGSFPDAGGRAGMNTVGRAGSGGKAGGSGSTEPEGGESGAGDGGAAGADSGHAGLSATGGTQGAGGGSGGVRAGGGGTGSDRGGSAGAGRGGAGGQAGGGGGGRDGGAGVGQGGVPATHAFFFSEYVEGSSSYKALEITAREDSTFGGCRLVTYFNGATAGSSIVLEGSLARGSSYVLCSTALAALLGAPCTRATNLTYNGDDALAIECDGVALDVIGQIGVDPGDAWTSGEASTLNLTLRRSCAASTGDTDGSNAFEPALEWSPFPIDTFDGLGVTECASSVTPEPSR